VAVSVCLGGGARIVDHGDGSRGIGRRAQLTVVKRCAFATSPYGRIGVYVTKGHVTCRRGVLLIHRMFYVAGKPTGAGDTERYSDGWLCGGQMGYYSCARPSTRHPKQSVEGIACHLGSVTCPKVVRLG
jgi:hypothetical protein